MLDDGQPETCASELARLSSSAALRSTNVIQDFGLLQRNDAIGTPDATAQTPVAVESISDVASLASPSRGGNRVVLATKTDAGLLVARAKQ
jgi:hypothetical protein